LYEFVSVHGNSSFNVYLISIYIDYSTYIKKKHYKSLKTDYFFEG
jgi:hypothetical protein